MAKKQFQGAVINLRYRKKCRFRGMEQDEIPDFNTKIDDGPELDFS